MARMAAQETMLTSRGGTLIRNSQDARRKTQNAFTFIEVLIALSVVSIALLAMLRLHLLTIRIADQARVTSQAIFLAQEKIAQTLAQGYPKAETSSGTVADNGVSLDWQVEVTDLRLPELGVAGSDGLRKILVAVSWKQRPGRKCVQMTTYVAKRDYIERPRSAGAEK